MKHWFIQRIPIAETVIAFFAGKDVPRHKYTVWYYFGGLTFFLFIIQLITGILLLFYYEPSVEPVYGSDPVAKGKQLEDFLFDLTTKIESDSSRAYILESLNAQGDARVKVLYPSRAYASIIYIKTKITFGWLIHSVHSWSAHAMVLMLFIHMFSVFFMKAYRKPREMLWLSGFILFVLVLGFGFTGYLLPWDEVAYYATSIGTEYPKAIPLVGEWIIQLLRGSNLVTGETLTRMFALHTVILPLCVIGLTAFHVFIVLVQGSSIPIGVKERPPRIPFFQQFIYRDIIVWLGACILLLVLSYYYPWEVGIPFDVRSPSPPPPGIHPEWYFMFLFQTLNVIPARFVGIDGILIGTILFSVVGVFWFIIPFVDRNSQRGEKSPLFTFIGAAGFLYIVIMTIWAYISVH